MAQTHYIKDSNGEFIKNNGKLVNVLDAYEISPSTKRLTAKYEWDEKDQLRFINRFEKAKRDADGAYGALDKSLIERMWWGANLFWMSKWMVPRFDNMFASKRFSFEEGTHVTGYLRDSLWTMVDVIKYLYNGDTRSFNFIRSALTGDQKDNLRQTGTQFIMLTALAIGIRYLMGYDDEDEDRFEKMKKRGAVYTWALYGLLKGKAEAESLFLPYGVEELNRKLKNPVPQLIPFSDDIYKIVWRDFNWSKPYGMFNEDVDFAKTYKVDSGYAEKGDTKALIDFYKLLGLSNTKSTGLFDVLEGKESSGGIAGVKSIESFSK